MTAPETDPAAIRGGQRWPRGSGRVRVTLLMGAATAVLLAGGVGAAVVCGTQLGILSVQANYGQRTSDALRRSTRDIPVDVDLMNADRKDSWSGAGDEEQRNWEHKMKVLVARGADDVALAQALVDDAENRNRSSKVPDPQLVVDVRGQGEGRVVVRVAEHYGNLRERDRYTENDGLDMLATSLGMQLEHFSTTFRHITVVSFDGRSRGEMDRRHDGLAE